MDLEVARLCERCQIASGGSNSPAAQLLFLDALNSVLSDVNTPWGTAYAQLTNVSGTFEIEEYEQNALFLGTLHYLQQNKAWAKDPDAESFQKYDKAVRRATAARLGAMVDDESLLTRNQVEA